MKKIIEQTSSGASGSFETSMGSGMVRRNFHPFFDIDSEEVQPKKKKKQLNKKKKTMKRITVSEIENIILKTLIQEEVYSEKPIEQKGRDISSKNAKSGIASKTAKKVSDITAKSGKESKSDVSVRNKKVSASLKNNLKGAEVKDVNKFKKVDDDYETEAYQNGMEDIAYERISDEQKKKNIKNIVSPELRKNPNAETSEKVSEKMISQAKKRKISRDASPFTKIAASGTDIEFLPDSKKQPLPNPRKKLAFENLNTMKRLTFKNQFRDDKDMLRKIPSDYKKNDLVFEMYDGDSNYKVRWEGTANNGVGVIIEHNSASKEMKNLKMFESLNRYDRLDFQSERNVKSSTLNENQIFKQMLNQSRRLMNEEPEPEPQTSSEIERRIVFDKLVGINDNQPATANAGIDTGIKNPRKEVQYEQPIGISLNILVPAPTEPISSANLAAYNEVLSGEASYGDNNTFDFGVTFDGEKYSLGEKSEMPPNFPVVGGTEIGGGKGNMLTPDNSNPELIAKIEQSPYKDRAVTVPAPLVRIATETETVEKYNNELSSFIKKYYPKLGVEIEWDSLDGKSFIDGKYKIKGQESAPMFNFFNDRAYTYMKIGKDVYYQKQGAGKDKKDPKQYTKINPTTQGSAYSAINNLQFTATGTK